MSPKDATTAWDGAGLEPPTSWSRDQQLYLLSHTRSARHHVPQRRCSCGLCSGILLLVVPVQHLPGFNPLFPHQQASYCARRYWPGRSRRLAQSPHSASADAETTWWFPALAAAPSDQSQWVRRSIHHHLVRPAGVKAAIWPPAGRLPSLLPLLGPTGGVRGSVIHLTHTHKLFPGQTCLTVG